MLFYMIREFQNLTFDSPYFCLNPLSCEIADCRAILSIAVRPHVYPVNRIYLGGAILCLDVEHVRQFMQPIRVSLIPVRQFRHVGIANVSV